MKIARNVSIAVILLMGTAAAQSDVPIPTLPGPVCSKQLKKNHQPCVTPPHPISSPEPEYPKEAENSRIEADVLVWLVVTEEGKPASVKIKKAAGHGFDRAAYEAVKLWIFAPARYEGKPIAAIAEVQVSFRISGTNSRMIIAKRQSGLADLFR